MVERVATDPGIRRILVLGPPDAGKSTLCRAMLRRMALEGRNAALLDADPVQKLIGPPACVTLGQGAGQRAAALAFIGTVNPLQGWRRLITGTGCLAAEVGDRTPLLVNTSGLLAGAGRRLKAAKIAAVRPDLLVAVGEGMELDAVLADHRTIPTTRLPRSPHARRKGEGERRALRRSAFRDYFATAPAWTLPLERLWVEGERPDEASAAVGRLLALAGPGGGDLTIAIVLGDERPGRLLLRAPRPDTPPHGLRWGMLRLGEDFSDRPAATRSWCSPRRGVSKAVWIKG